MIIIKTVKSYFINYHIHHIIYYTIIGWEYCRQSEITKKIHRVTNESIFRNQSSYEVL